MIFFKMFNQVNGRKIYEEFNLGMMWSKIHQ